MKLTDDPVIKQLVFLLEVLCPVLALRLDERGLQSILKKALKANGEKLRGVKDYEKNQLTKYAANSNRKAIYIERILHVSH